VEQPPIDFADFYRDRRDSCLQAVVANVGDRELAEDLVADAFAKAWIAWAKVGRHPAPQAWVVRTALNTGVSWWRKRRREQPLSERETRGQDDPQEGVDAAVMAAVRALPKRQREVIALRIFLDLDTEMTAHALGIAAGTVTAHLARATAALRIAVAPIAGADVEQPTSRKDRR
jgi:RNA polymerase sigma-70 factor (sigma-E family)